MPGALPTPNACCSTCPDSESGGGSNIPGPQGEPGADGENGTNGVNAYTTLTSGFTQPNSGSNVTIAVSNTSWMAVGQNVFIRSGGDYEVISIGSATAATVKNLGYPNNAAPAASVANSSQVTPSGQRGAAGADGSSAANPTTTKGDLSTHDASAAARLAVGTDGQLLMADSAQATGIKWTTSFPGSATDNAIARYDGTTGKVVQDSNISITDHGALQTIGGDARGSRAVDLQTQRGSADQVASGSNSFLGSGFSNKVSGNYSGVVCGQSNTTGDGFDFIGAGSGNTTGSGGSSFIGGGSSNSTAAANTTVGGGSGNSITQSYGFIGGGSGNVVSGQYGVVSGGTTNTVSANNAAIVGGSQGVADKTGQVTHANGIFASQGDAQTSELLWRNETSDATPTELFLDGASARATVGASFTWGFQGIIAGRDSSGKSASWKFEGTIKNIAGSTTLSATVTPELISADAAITGTWGQASNVEITADDTNDSLKIAVTGAAATNIRWVAHARIVEVKY